MQEKIEYYTTINVVRGYYAESPLKNIKLSSLRRSIPIDLTSMSGE